MNDTWTVPSGGQLTEKAVKALEKWQAVLTLEQFEQLGELCVLTKDMAILRESDQSLTVVFNDRGFPRGFNASNNVRPIKPVGYKAE